MKKSEMKLENQIEQIFIALRHQNWSRIWRLMNTFASGNTQNQWPRVEPTAVLGEVYLLLAEIDTERRKALPDLNIASKKKRKAA